MSRQFQLPPSPVVVILAVGDPTYTADSVTVGDCAFPVAAVWKPPLGQSAARRHLSSNAAFRNRLKTYLFSRPFPL